MRPVPRRAARPWALLTSKPRIGPTSPLASFDAAKRTGWRMFRDHQLSFYCGCAYYGSEGRRAASVDHWSCPTSLLTPTRRGRSASSGSTSCQHHVSVRGESARLETPCIDDEGGEHGSGRERCRAIDDDYRMMHNDLHNLVPAVGQVNAIRSDPPQTARSPARRGASANATSRTLTASPSRRSRCVAISRAPTSTWPGSTG